MIFLKHKNKLKKNKGSDTIITENRIINRKNLKQLCIDLDLYTLGTSEEYEEMLKSAVFEEHLTTEKIVEIAKNILEHSETDIELGSLCAEINSAFSLLLICCLPMWWVLRFIHRKTRLSM